jgi:hypothetical protein
VLVVVLVDGLDSWVLIVVLVDGLDSILFVSVGVEIVLLEQ